MIVDGCNLLTPKSVPSAAFEHMNMGRSSRAKQWAGPLESTS